MEEIIKIKLLDENLCDEENKETLIRFYNGIIDQAKKSSIWDESIKSILITDDLEKEINKQADIWNIKSQISKEKEYRVVSKVLFNQKIDSPEHKIYIPFQNFYFEKLSHSRIILGQIITIYAKSIIPREILQHDIDHKTYALNDYIISSAIDWVIANYTRKRLNQVLNEELDQFHHNSFLIAFKRKLKKNLFEYNSDQFDNEKRLGIFWYNYFSSINTLFLRLAETNYEKAEIQVPQTESSYNLIYQVLTEIDLLTDKLISKNEFNILPLKESIKKFSEHFQVFLEDEREDTFRIRLTKDPKDYFKDEIVETEPRFVCFIDILGFSDLINEYEKNITSTILQDIQESFAQAKTYLFANKGNKPDEVTRNLSYQTFSDNICISIPYFDNETDYISNFNLIATYVRGLQLALMEKGFFTRGGISTGSYYSDNNIIFSKGLVNAYFLESKKAIYPRVIIDKLIIEKLKKYKPESITFFGLEKVIIFDWEDTAFLNPFGLKDSSLAPFKSMINEFITDTDDPVINSLNNITKTFGDLTINLLDIAEEAEKTSFNKVKNLIAENIVQYRNEENILSKYLWLDEFIKWIDNIDSGKLKFTYFNEMLLPDR
jgi:hypothetical protein